MPPIKPENVDRYPPNWKSEIRPRILARAQNKCECCGVQNHSIGFWGQYNFIVEMTGANRAILKALKAEQPHPPNNPEKEWVFIVLTIAHLDHTPENCADTNLRAMCQRCHLRYDAEHHQASRFESRRKEAAIGDLFEEAA